MRFAAPLLATGLALAAWAGARDARAHTGPHAELQQLDAALADKPGDVDLLLRRAELHRREGHLEAARADLTVIEHVAPNRRELFFERGLTRAASGDLAGAEADLTRFLQGPASAAALVARAEVRERMGRADDARADYDAAIKLRPEPETFLARGRIDEAKGALDRAAQGYEEGLSQLGGAVSIRLALLRVERARGRHDRVIALADEAMATSPLKAEWLLVRADASAQKGQSQAALRDRTAALREVDETLKRRPNDLARILRARVLIALSRAAEATRELEGVIARSPNLPDAKTWLIEARRRAGRRSP